MVLGRMRWEAFSPLDQEAAAFVPSLWPVMGPITSSFGQREDPILGNGEESSTKGLDISAPNGTPIRATGRRCGEVGADGEAVMGVRLRSITATA